MPSLDSKKRKARDLYEFHNSTFDALARQFGVKEHTIIKWSTDGGWRRQTLVQQGKDSAQASVQKIESTIDKLKKVSKKEQIVILDMAGPVLRLAFENLHTKLMMEKDSGELSSIRDYAGLIGKLSDVVGKITGETKGEHEDADSIRSRTLNEFKDFMGIITNDIPKLTARSETIDITQFESKTIE